MQAAWLAEHVQLATNDLHVLKADSFHPTPVHRQEQINMHKL